jgi:hypothetical protein
MVVTIVAAVISIILSQRVPEPTQVITPEQVERIIDQVIEHQQQPEPPPTTDPDCE